MIAARERKHKVQKAMLCLTKFQDWFTVEPSLNRLPKLETFGKYFSVPNYSLRTAKPLKAEPLCSVLRTITACSSHRLLVYKSTSIARCYTTNDS